MTTFIATEAELVALYGVPGLSSTVKVTATITPHYRAWIEASPFMAMASVGPEGLDCSPRGDAQGVVRVIDERTVAIPDRRGNDRIDTLRNIVRDPRVALMFLIPRSGTILRLNGTARITADRTLLADYAVDGKPPRTVVLVAATQVYFQCARAVKRSRLWDGGHADVAGLPTVGTMLQALSDAAIDGDAYDKAWPERASASLW